MRFIKNNSLVGGLYGEYQKSNQSETNSGKKGAVEKKDVLVHSLSHNVGTSHVSAAIANYLSISGCDPVGLISDSWDKMSGLVEDEIVRLVRPLHDKSVMADCACVVEDGGVWQSGELNKRTELVRATTVMVCQADDEFLQRLAAFVESQGKNADHMIFLFNMLPTEWHGKVRRVMRDYEAYCLPLFHPKNIKGEVEKIFYNMFKQR